MEWCESTWAGWRSGCLAGLLLLSGCALGPDFVAPEAPGSGHYLAGGDPATTEVAEGQAQWFESGVAPVAHWWTLFGSSRLDALVTDGLAHNPGLEAAQASLLQSREALEAGYGVFYPQVSADVGATREKFSPVLFGSTAPGPTFNLFTLSTSVSYALDVFGGQRRAVESLQAQEAVQHAQLLGSYLTLTGNLVNTAIARAAYRDEIEQTRQLIKAQREQVAVAETQISAGVSSDSARLALHAQQSAYEATLAPLLQKADQADHLLATLSGKLPEEGSDLTLEAFTLPPNLPLSLPSTLVRNRPDILAAEAALHVASANIGVATAAQFPSFTLNGGFGQYATSPQALFAGSGNFWNLGLDVAAPLFNGGTLSARKAAAVEAYRQSAALYRETVLGAFAQVADAVRALQHDAEVLVAARQSMDDAKTSWHLLETNYRAGLVNGLQVLAAEAQFRQANIAWLQARAVRLQDTTAFFLAVGGKWE